MCLCIYSYSALTNATANRISHTLLLYCTCFGHTSSSPIESIDAVLSAAARGVDGRAKSARNRGHMMRPLPDTPGDSDVVHRDEVQTLARGGGWASPGEEEWQGTEGHEEG